MKLGQGVNVLSVVCAGLLTALALWRHGEPLAQSIASESSALEDATSPCAHVEELDDCLVDPPAVPTRTQATPNPVDVRLVPFEDGVRMCGSVKGPDGTPPVNARVALFLQLSNAPEASPLYETKCEGDGTFCVSTDRTGDFALAVFAPGLRPATRTISLSLGEVHDLGEIELEPGAAIEGAVHADGEPQPGVEMVAILASTGAALRTSDASLRWTRDRFEWSFTTAKNQADGQYRIAGLRPGRYRVRVSAMRGPKAIFGHRTLDALTIDAPSTEVDFKLVTSNLEVHIECGGEPVCGASIDLEAQGIHLGRQSDDFGVVRMRALPKIACNLLVQKSGYRARRLSLDTPPAGRTRREVVELERVAVPDSKWATLSVELTSKTGEAIERASFSFYSADTNLRDPVLSRANIRPSRTPIDEAQNSSARTSASAFVIDEIPSGRYRVVIHAGEELVKGYSPPTTKYCDADFVISAVGSVSRRVSLEARGCADVSAHDTSGKPVAALFRLVSNGNVTIPTFRAWSDWNGLLGERGRLEDEGPTRIYAEPCSGTYELEFSYSGYATRRVPVKLVPGLVSKIDVTLVPEGAVEATAISANPR